MTESLSLKMAFDPDANLESKRASIAFEAVDRQETSG